MVRPGARYSSKVKTQTTQDPIAAGGPHWPASGGPSWPQAAKRPNPELVSPKGLGVASTGAVAASLREMESN